MAEPRCCSCSLLADCRRQLSPIGLVKKTNRKGYTKPLAPSGDAKYLQTGPPSKPTFATQSCISRTTSTRKEEPEDDKICRKKKKHPNDASYARHGFIYFFISFSAFFWTLFQLFRMLQDLLQARGMTAGRFMGPGENVREGLNKRVLCRIRDGSPGEAQCWNKRERPGGHWGVISPVRCLRKHSQARQYKTTHAQTTTLLILWRMLQNSADKHIKVLWEVIFCLRGLLHSVISVFKGNGKWTREVLNEYIFEYTRLKISGYKSKLKNTF